MVDDAQALHVGTVMVSDGGWIAVLSERKSDGSGWWCAGGGGLCNETIEDGTWSPEEGGATERVRQLREAADLIAQAKDTFARQGDEFLALRAGRLLHDVREHADLILRGARGG